MHDREKAVRNKDKAARLNKAWGVGAVQARYSDEGQPAPCFEPATPDLKDVYFCAMQGWQAAPAEAPQAEGRAA